MKHKILYELCMQLGVITRDGQFKLLDQHWATEEELKKVSVQCRCRECNVATNKLYVRACHPKTLKSGEFIVVDERVTSKDDTQH